MFSHPGRPFTKQCLQIFAAMRLHKPLSSFSGQTILTTEMRYTCTHKIRFSLTSLHSEIPYRTTNLKLNSDLQTYFHHTCMQWLFENIEKRVKTTS